MRNLYIVAVLHVKENYLMDAIEILKKLVHETRKEEGCLQYDLIEDIENKGIFFIVELWETEEHHFKHLGTEHYLNYRLQSTSLMEEATMVYKGFKRFKQIQLRKRPKNVF